MFKHAAHLWICGAIVAGALIAVAVSGNAAAFLPVAACVWMMVVMMSLMARGHSRRHKGL